MKTCNQCKHYRPAVNPETGRQLPSRPGKCDWPIPWPEEWPMAYKWGRGVYPPPPQGLIYNDSRCDHCETFEPAKPSKIEGSGPTDWQGELLDKFIDSNEKAKRNKK